MTRAHSQDDWTQIDALFHEAVELRVDERAAFVERATRDAAGDESNFIRTEVMRLLELHDADSTFLESPVVAREQFEEAARSARQSSNAGQIIGRTVGQYVIERLIGEGGMGLVYLARQQRPQRQVALKIIRPAFASPAAVRRFESETNILARLKHPGIAQIYDAGSAELDGGPIPYFAMELVEGRPMTQYVRDRDLDLASRIGLLIDVCEAVQHAHLQGVIHRDLKPGNILVTTADRKRDDAAPGEPVPKILDFGIARLVDSPNLHTIQSGGSALIGTLAYMSHEQLSGEPDMVDARSDVYALGVLMYEVLAGAQPHDLRECSILEAIRMVSDSAPRSLAGIDNRFRGDLDTIARTAIARDKDRRYQSAGALAGDLRRFLELKPIAARPPSVVYSVRMFVRRHRAVSVASALILILALAGTFTTWWQRSETLAREAETTLAHEFLGELLTFVNDPASRSDDRVIAALERVSAEIETAFVDRPIAEAQVRETLGDAFIRIGRFDEAATQYHTSYEIRKHELGPRDVKTWAALAGLGSTRLWQQRPEEAITILSDVVEARRRLLGDSDQRTLWSMSDLASAHSAAGQVEQAEQLFRETLELLQKHRGETDRDTLVCALNLANLLRDQKRFGEAEPLYRERVAAFRTLYGENNVDTLAAMDNLAVFLKRAGRPDEAEPVYRTALAGFRRVLGDDHPGTLTAMYNFGTFLWGEQRRDESLVLLAEASGIASESLKPDNSMGHSIRLRYADFLKREDNYEKSERVLRDLFDQVERAIGIEHGQTQRIARDLVKLYERWEKPEQAAEYRALLSSNDE